MLASKFSFFTTSKTLTSNSLPLPKSNRFKPTLKLQTDKEVYRPGDAIFITIEISNQISTVDSVKEENLSSFLIEKLGFEIVGIQKLDSQWFVTPKPIPGSKQRRGENVFLECSSASLVSNQIISSGSSKTYVVRAVLPSVIPPSYKGATVRYMYYIRSSLAGRLLMLENGNSYPESSKDVVELEARSPLQIWVTQKSNGLIMEETLSDGIVPATAIQMDMYWKEMDGDSEWARANDLDDGGEEGYESSRDEISSVSTYNPTKETIHKTFGSSLSLQSSTAKSSTRDTPFIEGGRTSLSSTLALPRLSVAEVMYDSGEAVLSPSRQQKMLKSQSEDDNAAGPSASGAGSGEATASEGFIRGRSYNIRMDDRVLLRFSPRNSDSTYYFSDMIGGTLTFFHEEGARRCLEVSITLETSETVNRRFVHPSRRNSPTITKVQSDHHEVVADLIQTSFLFSIPMDGPMSFSTPHVSVQWVLRFEFLTTPKNVDWTRYDHPLLVDGRDKSEWVLPIVVHAPPPQAASHDGKNRPFSLDPLWVGN